MTTANSKQLISILKDDKQCAAHWRTHFFTAYLSQIRDKYKSDKDLLYIAGILSDCQELLSPDLNGEESEGWVSPHNAKDAIALMNKAKELLFKKMEEK